MQSSTSTTNLEDSATTRVPLDKNEPKTVVELFLSAARVHHKPNALNYKRGGEWHPVSSTEILDRARCIALGLYSLGVKRGDRAGILSENCPEWTLADAGCQFAGVIDVPIYSTLTPQQVAFILKDSGVRVLMISNRAKYEAIRDALNECTALEFIVFFAEKESGGGICQTLSEVEMRGTALSESEPDLAGQLAGSVHAEDLATLIYTSGTTGEPKGVMLTHSNLMTNVIDSSSHLSFGESDIALSILPLSHVLERMAMYMYLHHGMTIYYAESIDAVGKNLLEVRPTIVICVPRLFEKMYARAKDKASRAGRLQAGIFSWSIGTGKRYARQMLENRSASLLLSLKYRLAEKLVFEKWRSALGGRIRLFVSGGAALSDDIGWIFQGLGVPIVQGYGLTETSPVIAAGSLDENRIGTVGKPIRNVEVRIAADGEIETRGPNVMKGYYNKPAETAAVLTEGGWFKTGDIGTLDADGFLRITDRKKELFKTSGGKYIAPQPVEQMIKNSRFVNQVVLIGNGRKFPAALIVPDWEQLNSYARLKNIDLKTSSELIRDPRILDLFQRQVDSNTNELANYEKVKRVALLPNELTIEGGELTPTLKVKRRVIDEKYKNIIDRLYEDAESEGAHQR